MSPGLCAQHNSITERFSPYKPTHDLRAHRSEPFRYGTVHSEHMDGRIYRYGIETSKYRYGRQTCVVDT